MAYSHYFYSYLKAVFMEKSAPKMLKCSDFTTTKPAGQKLRTSNLKTVETDAPDMRVITPHHSGIMFAYPAAAATVNQRSRDL